MGLCSSQAKNVEGGDKPEPKKQETKQEEPAAAKEEQVAKKEEPAAAKEEPKAVEEPAAAKEEPKAAEEPAAAKKEPKAAEESQAPVEEPKAVEEPQALAEAPVAAPVSIAPEGDLPPYTNRPEDLEGLPAASGAFKPRAWDLSSTPDMSGSPALTGEIVTDGKVSFDKAALELDGVFASRDEEVAQLQKAIDLKKDAAAETGKANALHEEHNKLYEAGDKDGAKAKLAESKTHREAAQKIHQESFDLAVGGAMSMAIKALYSKYPSVDYHVFLMDPFEKTFQIVIDMQKKYGKYGRKDFLVIPGEGQHSGAKGPLIRPHLEEWMKNNNVTNEQITSGSYSIVLESVPAPTY